MSDNGITSEENNAPVFLDPELISDFIKLTSGDIAQTGQLGNAIAINGNGVIVAGARDDAPDNSYQAGSVIVYTPLEDGTYTEHQLTAPDGVAGDHFGDAVTIADDGTVVVSATTASPSGTSESGAIYVFKTDSNGGYTDPIKLTASDATQLDNFGSSVVMNEDGQIVVGAAGDDANGGLGAGSVYVYTPDASGNYNEVKLIAPAGEGLAKFGSSITLNDNGLVVVGAKGEQAGTGALYVYRPSEEGYADPVRLEAPQLQVGDQLGASVVVNEAGHILVSQPGNWVDGEAAAGSVLLYIPEMDGEYVDPIEFKAADGDASDMFGSDVAINASGTFVVAAAHDEANGYASGSVYVFVPQDNGTYKEFKIGVPDVVAGDRFGFAVAISDDGTVTIGKPGNDSTTEINIGAVYVIKPDANGDYSRPANELTLYETTDTSDIAGQLSLSFSDADVADAGHSATVKGISLSGVENGLSKLTEQQLLDLLSIASIDSINQAQLGKVNLDFSAGYEVFNYLAEGEEVTLTYTVELADGNGGTAEGTAKIIVIGTNDTPQAEDVEVTVSEDDRNYIIQTGLVDPDRSDRLSITWAADSIEGGLVRYGKNFKYSASPHFNYLAEGETATETFTYTADDGHGGVITRNVTINVEGQNDRPIVRDIEVTTIENEGVVIAPDYRDVDASDTHTISFDNSETKGAVTFVDGVFHYDPNGQFDYLTERQKATDTFTYTVDDGHGGVVTKTITVTITALPNPISISHVEALPKIVETGIFGRYDTELSHNGSTLAITEGDVIVVGSDSSNASKSNGAVYVLVPDGNGGRETAKLTASGTGFANGFGGAVAANKYGTIIVGADELDSVQWTSKGGGAYIYSRTSNGEYVEHSLPAHTDDGGFGRSVAINDLDVAVVASSRTREDDLSKSAAIYVYSPAEDGSFAETRLATPAIKEGDYYASDIAINNNGTIVVSVRSASDIYSYVYQPDGFGGYIETELAYSAGNAGGSNIAINDNGTIVIGQMNDDENGYHSGAVFVYQLNDSGEYIETKLLAEDGQRDDYFGNSVSINEHGVIVVGAWGADTEDQWNRKGNESGAIYIYTPDGSGEYRVQKLTEPNTELNYHFGTSVYINDAGVITVSATKDESNSGSNGQNIIYEYYPNADGNYGVVTPEAIIDETSDDRAVEASLDVVFEDKYHSDHDFTSDVLSVTAEGEISGLDESTLLDLLSPNDFSFWRYADLPQGQGKAHFEFNASSEMFDYLKRGESITLTYTVEIDNGSGEPATQEVKITINGRDDLGTNADDHLIGSEFNDYIYGLEGDDIISGEMGADTLEGGQGDDTLTGGSSTDTFRFKGTDFGHDVITDMEAGIGVKDVIELDKSVFADFDAVLAAANSDGNNTVITLNAESSITLQGVSLGDLHQDDFTFV